MGAHARTHSRLLTLSQAIASKLQYFHACTDVCMPSHCTPIDHVYTVFLAASTGEQEVSWVRQKSRALEASSKATAPTWLPPAHCLATYDPNYGHNTIRSTLFATRTAHFAVYVSARFLKLKERLRDGRRTALQRHRHAEADSRVKILSHTQRPEWSSSSFSLLRCLLKSVMSSGSSALCYPRRCGRRCSSPRPLPHNPGVRKQRR